MNAKKLKTGSLAALGKVSSPNLITTGEDADFLQQLQMGALDFFAKKVSGPSKVKILCWDHLESVNWPH